MLASIHSGDGVRDSCLVYASGAKITERDHVKRTIRGQHSPDILLPQEGNLKEQDRKRQKRPSQILI